MILSWLQNHLETLGGRAAWSWHFSCVQTVAKLQLHSVLATLYLLSMPKNTPFLCPLFQTVKRGKATWQVSQRLPQCNLFLTPGLQISPLISGLLCLSVGHGRGTIALGRFSSVKDKAASYLCQFKYWLFPLLPPSVKWGDSQNLQKDSIIHSL